MKLFILVLVALIIITLFILSKVKGDLTFEKKWVNLIKEFEENQNLIFKIVQVSFLNSNTVKGTIHLMERNGHGTLSEVCFFSVHISPDEWRDIYKLVSEKIGKKPEVYYQFESDKKDWWV